MSHCSKHELLKSVLGLFLLIGCAQAQAGTDFAGALASPRGSVAGPVKQITVQFPGAVIRTGNDNPFSVTCFPAVKGFGSWADNDTKWTYNFQAPPSASGYRADDSSNDDSNRAPDQLVGGSQCQVTQTVDLTSDSGKVWKAGQISYGVSVDGPNVVEVYAASGFNDTLRENEPMVIIVFDGPVDRDQFFSNQGNYLSYLSSNAPSEKMPLAPVPADQSAKLFASFKAANGLGAKYQDKTWVIATIKQNLIPGSQVNLSVQNQVSGVNSAVVAKQKYTKEFKVRSEFEAQVQCEKPTANNANCLPQSPINIALNGRVKWTDLKQAYIEYLPYQAANGRLVRSFPEMAGDQDVNLWDKFVYTLADYFPYLARFSDTVVDHAVFNVSIEPETQARVVLPPGLVDIDGRALSNAIAEFNIRIGTMGEIIHVPQTISFFERNVPNLYLPVGVVNLNQTLTIRKSGTDAKTWAPIRDVGTMIKVIRAYDHEGPYRSTPNYVSPLDQSGVASTVINQKLKGARNRPDFLQFPFGSNPANESGFYALEVTSASYEQIHSTTQDHQYFNPKYVLAQVTDLAVHLKKGQNNSVAWVTSLSEAQSIAGAQVEIYNCLGQKVTSYQTNASGLVTFPNKVWAKDCQAGKDDYSPYSNPKEFFIVARAGNDQAMTHSTWSSPVSYAMSAPGVDYFYSDISENTPHFQSIIGVNLVKPGQRVPVELVAKMPTATGFGEVPAAQLPKLAHVVSSSDPNTYYEFPLTWANGTAHFEWNVPADSSVQLGRYVIQLTNGKKDPNAIELESEDIEVAEFKIPLMTGLIAFPNQALVQPDSIPVNASVQYANGVGAKNLNVDVSYYFEPTSLHNKDFADFNFGSGLMQINSDSSGGTSGDLPRNDRPATIEGLKTAADGSLSKDLAAEKTPDGRPVSEVLKTLNRPQKLVARVRYQDQMGEFQTLSQSKVIFNANRYVGTSLTSGSRTDARLLAAVVDVANKNVTSLNDLDIKVLRVDSKVIGEELFGGLIKNTIERELKPTHWINQCSVQQQVVSCPVGALQAGGYAFQVTYKSTQQAAHILFKIDTEGRVYGEKDYYNSGDDDSSKQLPLALDKKTYKEGDKAVVSFTAPFKNCRALVTIERSDIMQSFIAPNACEKGFVEVPVSASEAPNVFVSVYAITGRAQTAPTKIGDLDFGRPTYRLGFANLKVNWSRFKSTVAVTTDKETYKPGDTVHVQVSVKADEGNLSGGAVTLVAIEENILELKKNSSYNVLDSLMRLRGHTVETITPLERVETVTVQNTDLPSDDDRKGGDEGGDGSAKSDFKRKLFDALVTFQADVPVVNGVAKVSFKTNDSLTRFKIIAIANDSSQKFGLGEVSYVTAQDTQTYSNIPSVARVGDSYPVRVTVQNNGKQSSTFKTEVVAVIKDSSGKVISTKTLTKSGAIGAASSVAVDLGQLDFGSDASRIEYSVHVYDSNGKLVDAMEPAAQTILPAIPLAVHTSFIVQVDSTSSTLLNKETDALADKGEIRVTLANSLVTTALQQIVQNLQNSAFADFLLESRFDKALLTGSQAKPQDLTAVLQTVLSSTDSHGFVKAYPQASSGSLWLTAHILNSLQEEPWAKKLVPSALSDKLKSATSQVLTKSVDPSYVGTTPMDWLRAQAIMASAASFFNDQNLLASAKAVNATMRASLQKDPNAYGAPIEKWAPSDLADIWLMQVKVSPASAFISPIYKSLTSPAHLVSIGNVTQVSSAPVYGAYYSDETIDTAKLLWGHSHLKGDKNLARTLAVGLVNSSSKAWYNTDTMMAVAQGLKSFGLAYESEVVNGLATVSVVEENAQTSVDWSHASATQLVTPWTHQKATVQVKQSGTGQPWVAVQGLTAVPLKAPYNQGLSVEKQIRNVTHDTGFQAGDIIEVTLQVHANAPVRSIVMQDPIPAGSNILSNAYGEFSTGQKSYSAYKFYFDALPEGVTTVKYQFQLNNPGTFNLPPTRAEGLYMPSIYGETPNSAVTVN